MVASRASSVPSLSSLSNGGTWLQRASYTRLAVESSNQGQNIGSFILAAATHLLHPIASVESSILSSKSPNTSKTLHFTKSNTQIRIQKKTIQLLPGKPRTHRLPNQSRTRSNEAATSGKTDGGGRWLPWLNARARTAANKKKSHKNRLSDSSGSIKPLLPHSTTSPRKSAEKNEQKNEEKSN